MKHHSIKPLMLITIMICTAAVLTAPAYFIYQNVKTIVVDALGRSAISIAATISEFAAFNFENYQNIPLSSFENFTPDATIPNEDVAPPSDLEIGDGTEADSQSNTAENDTESAPDPFQERLKNIFADLMLSTGAQAIYIERRLSEENKAYLFNEDYADKARYYGSTALTEEELLAFNEGITVPSTVLNDDSVGEYIAGYAPIKNPSNDKVVGIVVVEFSLTHVQIITNSIRNIVLISFGTIIILATLIVYLLLKSRQKYFKKDYLTELCNKNYFQKRLKMQVRLSDDTNKPLSLIMIDVDHFKTINDTLGHPAGDKVLQSVSETIRSQTRDCDLCARYGGDEFAVLLTNSDIAQAVAVAERIRQKTELYDHLLKYTINHPEEHSKLTVTLSIGVAQLVPDMTPEAFTEAADQALYHSKNTGKNRVTVFKKDLLIQANTCPQQI